MRPFAVAAAMLALAGPAHSRQAPADTLPADSAFAHAGPVLRWNVAARALIERAITARAARPARPTFYDGNNNSRLYALVAGAQYDALRQATGRAEASAAITAAGSVLAVVFPDDAAWIRQRLSAETAELRRRGLSATDLRAGERAGRAAARQWTSAAEAEQRVPPWQGRVPAGPGRWRGEGTNPALAISVGLRPWFLRSSDELRPPPPPAPGTPPFEGALAAVRTATTERTREQTRATWAWARNAATLWSEIAGDIIVRDRLSEPDAARALMYLNMTLSDATIACWDAKLFYWFPRPSEVDSTIDMSVPLPNFPSYPSAHATLFAAGAAILGRLVPEERGRLDSLAGQATSSRVWAGVHYPFDNAAGTTLGRRVAEAAIAVLDAEAPAAAAKAAP